MGIQQIPLASSGLSASDLRTEPVWTYLTSVGANNVTSVTFDNISSDYKILKLVIPSLYNTGNGYATWIQVNYGDDQTLKYVWFGERQGFASTVTNTRGTFSGSRNNMFWLTDGWRNTGYNGQGEITIYDANTTLNRKKIVSEFGYYNEDSNALYDKRISYANFSTAISSIKFTCADIAFYTQENMLLYGGN